MQRTSVLIAIAIVASIACKQPAQDAAAAPESSVKRGEYLVAVLGCDDCHSPKVMGPAGPAVDKSRRLSGHPAGSNLPSPPALGDGPWGAVATLDLTAWSGPWGITYSVNLTPDENTGLGIWTEEMFVKMIRTGKHMGQSRPVLPPMPIVTYQNLSDDDLKAVFAFLRTLPPVSNPVPDAVIAPPPGS